MVATVEDIRRALSALESRSDGEFAALISEVSRLPVDSARDVLQRAVPGLLDPYVTAAGELGASWYEELRSASAAGGSFTARVPDLPSAERIAALVGWAVSPMYGQSGSTVLSLLAGGVQKMISGATRAAVEENAQIDRVLVGYARIPRPGCCAFCALLASRGPVYNSSSSAGGVVGRGTDESVNFRADGTRRRGGQALGIRARGTQNLGDAYHDRCHCVVTPVFQGGDPIISQVVRASEARYLEQYQQVAAGSLSDYSRRNPDSVQFNSADFKATLANWRSEFGTR